MEIYATTNSPVIHVEATAPVLQTQSPPPFSPDCAPSTLVVVPPVNPDGSLHYFYCLPPDLPFVIYPFNPVLIVPESEQPTYYEPQVTTPPRSEYESTATLKTAKPARSQPKRSRTSSGIKKKKAINPYIAFSIEMRKRRLQADPFIGNRQLILEIGQMWSQLSLAEREEYAVLAKKLTEELD